MEQLLSQSETLGIYLACGIPMVGFAFLWLKAEYKNHKLENKLNKAKPKAKKQYAFNSFTL